MAHEDIQATNRVFEEEVIGRRDFGALIRLDPLQDVGHPVSRSKRR